MQLKVTTNDTTKRIDVFVTEKVGSVSRSFIHRLENEGKILVNGEKQKSGYKLRVNDIVTVDFDFAALQKTPTINLEVLYEDGDCIVINKLAGVLTHSKGAYNPEGTVATFIAPRLKGLEGERGGIVHRLDRGTSGVIICAKTPEALSWLQKQFSQRKVKKTYYAVVEGQMKPPQAIIEMPIERNPKSPKTFRVGKEGRPAVTQYETILSNATYSLLKLQPLTGRTHQLRVHLHHLGYPILGDILYDGEKAERLYLHAAELEITLPSKQRKVFTVGTPQNFMERLK